MPALTLEALIDEAWSRVATLEFPDESTGDAGQCFFEYDFDHLEQWLSSARHDVSASARLPLEFGPTLCRTWPSFLDDLRPMGSARRWWLSRLGLDDVRATDFRLLKEGTVAPVGNLRVAEAVPKKDDAPRRFPLEAVTERQHAFIAWAADHGAQVGGATGAGGDSPKVLLRRDADRQVWIDVWQDEPANEAAHLLVKFPRSRAARDHLILRSEYVYYRALAKLGVDTIDVGGLELLEGEAGPSLWMPRFDVRRRAGREVRLGVESVYSLMGARPGARLRHQDVLEVLRSVVSSAEAPSVTVEYVRRDLLNLVFGNSDNHGRNTSVLKGAETVWLAPVYDFAPMKLDLEGIARSTTWGPFERGGEVDWTALLPTFGEFEPAVRAALRDLAQQLVGLPSLLKDLGLPDEALNFAPLGLQFTQKRLDAWGLL